MFRMMGLKLSPLVRNEGGWDAETRDPTNRNAWATVSVQVLASEMTSGQ